VIDRMALGIQDRLVLNRILASDRWRVVRDVDDVIVARRRR